MEKYKTKKKISPSVTALIGTIITLIGGFFLSYNYVQSKKIYAFDYMANAFYDGNQVINILDDDQKTPLENNLPDTISTQYIGYLSIPKINLTKGFMDIRSPENDLEKNILVIEGSTYPDVEKGNLILAGHSGTGWKAFFNDLYKLSTNDLVYVKYKEKKYTYQIKNIYKNYDKTTLTLITCTNNDSKTQTIYIAELINTENA